MGPVFQILIWAFQLFQLAVIARVLLSWFPDIDQRHPVMKFLYDVTEPVLRPVRDMLRQSGMMMDLSPIVVILIILVLTRVLGGFAR